MNNCKELIKKARKRTISILLGLENISLYEDLQDVKNTKELARYLKYDLGNLILELAKISLPKNLLIKKEDKNDNKTKN